MIHSKLLVKLAKASYLINEVVDYRLGNGAKKQRLITIKKITKMKVIISGMITYGLKSDITYSDILSIIFIKSCLNHNK